MIPKESDSKSITSVKSQKLSLEISHLLSFWLKDRPSPEAMPTLLQNHLGISLSFCTLFAERARQLGLTKL